MKALLEIDPENLKSLRETLCMAQSAVQYYSSVQQENKMGHIHRIGALIDEIDKHRPLGSNGKHGKLHTATCGCDYNEKEKIEQLNRINPPA